MIYWFTGQPGAGKTVLCRVLKEFLETKFYKNVIHIDGDDIREIFDNKDYTKEGRYKNIILAQQIAKFSHLKGFDVVVSLVSPYRELRESFKKELGSNIKEMYVITSELRGREHYHSADYEPPIENFITVDTTNITVGECINRIV
jgi:adenylylsulfate kinase